MGFGRRFKGLGKLVKKGIKLAATSGIVPGSGTVASVVASKLASRGEKKRDMLAAQRLGRDNLKLAVSKGQPTRPPTVRGPAKRLKGIADPNETRAAAVRASSVARLAKFREVDAKIKKLSATEKSVLADEFKASGGGTARDFRSFLAARL